MKSTITVLTIVVTFSISSPLLAVEQYQYTYTELGTVGQESQAWGINNNGQIVGHSGYHAIRYDNNTMTQLGTNPASWVALAVNSSGAAAGIMRNNSGVAACIYDGSEMINIGNLGANYSYSTGINDSRQVVGWSYLTGMATTHAFIYADGIMTDIGTLGGTTSQANGINKSGQVVGYAYNASGIGRAFLYANGKMHDLGTLVGPSSVANAINDLGQVVGDAGVTSGTSNAFLYSNGRMTDLGVLPGTLASSATAINNKGQVVGYAYSTGSLPDRAFIYSNGHMTDLNSLTAPVPGWTLSHATGINDKGQIVGWAANSSGYLHAFLLTPIPEPSTLALLLTGCIGGLLWWRRR